jgi:hypothetical protein
MITILQTQRSLSFILILGFTVEYIAPNMKKVLIVIFISIVLFLAAIYVFIPRVIKVSAIELAPCIPKNIADCLRDRERLRKWWPKDDTSIENGYFGYNNYRYNLKEPFTDGADIELSKGENHFKSRIFIIAMGKDSSAVEWQASLAPGYNPFQRVEQYFDAREAKNNNQELLSNLLNFASKTENMYGFHIERTTFTDTILIATKFFTNSYPTTEKIYGVIDQLKKKINQEEAKEKDYPMLNVRQTDSTHFETMIAICINKEIKDSGNFFLSRMVTMKDRFLKTEVTGGSLSIKNAHKAIENYMNDHLLSAPAIPFEILTTDRSKETDTSKWKTIIFHPSM